MTPLHAAALAATWAVSMFGRLAWVRWRESSNQQFRSVHGLEDPRSRAELWLAKHESRLLVALGSAAVLVAAVAGLMSL